MLPEMLPDLYERRFRNAANSRLVRRQENLFRTRICFGSSNFKELKPAAKNITSGMNRNDQGLGTHPEGVKTMTDTDGFPDLGAAAGLLFDPHIAYIKPTPAAEARRMGILPPGIRVPDNLKLYVLHASDGRVLGFTDDWDSAYSAAVQNELTPLSVH